MPPPEEKDEKISDTTNSGHNSDTCLFDYSDEGSGGVVSAVSYNAIYALCGNIVTTMELQ